MNLKPVEVSDPKILDQIYRLRVEAWKPSGISPATFSSGLWSDVCDEYARHWAIFDGGRLLAAARLSTHQNLCDVPSSHLYLDLNMDARLPVASINRLVIHPKARRMGLSKKLDDIRIREAENAGCRSVVAYVWKISGDARLRSLIRQGFQLSSPLNFRVESPFGDVTTLLLTLPVTGTTGL